MMLLAWSCAFACLAQPGVPPLPAPIDPCESVVISQARAAISDVTASLGVHHGGTTTAVTAVFEGAISLEGHLLHPGDVHTIPVRLELIADLASGGLSIRETSGSQGRRVTETTLVLHGRMAEQAADGEPFKENVPEAAATAAADSTRWLPSTILQAARRASPSCRPGPAIDNRGQTLSPVTFTDAAGRACTVLIDAEHRVTRIESLSAHPRLGDVCSWTRFDKWEQIDGVAVPQMVTRFIVQSSATLRYDLTLTSFKAGPVPEGAFALPAARQADIPTWGRPPAPGMEFIQLAPSLWSVEVSASNSRVPVIEREKDLVLLGAPDDDAVCGDLISTLRGRFAGKPIGLVAFSHHHPSPSGGLRALAATGATIIAPVALEPYVRGLLSRPTSLGSPAIPGPAQPTISTFAGEMTIDCGDATVRLIDIAEHSAHAFSYVVFYFPGQGILMEDDLGYFPVDGAARASPRLTGLVDALDGLHVKPDRLIPGWPVRNARPEVEWKMVVDLVQAERERRQNK